MTPENKAAEGHQETDLNEIHGPDASGYPERLERVSGIVLPVLLDEFGSDVISPSSYRDELTISVPSENLLEVIRFLKEHPSLRFAMLKDVTAVDWYRRRERFQINYNLYSLENRLRVHVRTFTEEQDPHVESMTGLFRSADWYEREVYDMHGIIFDNHPDLRRMYMPEDFVDPETAEPLYPLRKDFPVMGVPGSLPLPEREITRDVETGINHGTAHK